MRQLTQHVILRSALRDEGSLRSQPKDARTGTERLQPEGFLAPAGLGMTWPSIHVILSSALRDEGSPYP
jgi:hypothetical protein